jgi:NAD(P)-dependent dehydrogenase (short-subunit alcohol dehydrogenase family)
MEDSLRIAITGVSRGLGRAMTDEFIARGHTLIGCARNADAIEALSRKFPRPHRFDVVDVANEPAVAAWAMSVLGDGGPPDLLVNNAALINASAALWEVPPEEFSRVVDANVKGTYHVVRHFVPAMVTRGRGVIVNFSSEWGRSTSPEEAPYCATKWAIEGLTKALAQELPAGMAAVPLSPGIIDTDMLRVCFGNGASAYPDAKTWAKTAVPFILKLGRKDNGKSLSVPQ